MNWVIDLTIASCMALIGLEGEKSAKSSWDAGCFSAEKPEPSENRGEIGCAIFTAGNF